MVLLTIVTASAGVFHSYLSHRFRTCNQERVLRAVLLEGLKLRVHFGTLWSYEAACHGLYSVSAGSQAFGCPAHVDYAHVDYGTKSIQAAVSLLLHICGSWKFECKDRALAAITSTSVCFTLENRIRHGERRLSAFPLDAWIPSLGSAPCPTAQPCAKPAQTPTCGVFTMPSALKFISETQETFSSLYLSREEDIARERAVLRHSTLCSPSIAKSSNRNIGSAWYQGGNNDERQLSAVGLWLIL